MKDEGYVIKSNYDSIDIPKLLQDAANLFFSKEYVYDDMIVFVSNSFMYWLNTRRDFNEFTYKVKINANVSNILDLFNIDFIIVPKDFRNEYGNTLIIFSINGKLYETEKDKLKNLIKPMKSGI